MTIRTSQVALVASAFVLAGTLRAEAEITRIEVTRTETPAFEGAGFGPNGQYEKLVGRAYGEIDPNSPLNAIIMDLDLAPRNANGMVEYATDFILLRPIDAAAGNGGLLFEINNRGNLVAMRQLNSAATGGNDPVTAGDAGNGFLMRAGYSMLSVGWDPTVAPGGGRLTVTVPIITNPDGSPITGRSMEEFVIDDATTMEGLLAYPAATLDKADATLTVRVRYDDTPVVVPPDRWEYNEAGTAVRLLPAGTAFQQGTLYSFVYTARDPIVAGIGLAAIRDVAEFFRNATVDETGAANPLAGRIERVFAACFSQPCRGMHSFVHLGFNQGEAGSLAIDGILNWGGAADQMFMNHRFGQPSKFHRQHIGRWFPTTPFPFTYEVLDDPVTGATDGWLAGCSATDTCPLMFDVNPSNDYWQRNTALLHIDPAGNDLADTAFTRWYTIASMAHLAITGPSGAGICQQERNPIVANAVLRALLVALDEWVAEGTEPPASRVPRVSEGTLVAPAQEAVGFPTIPGVTYTGLMHTGDLFDFGPRFAQGFVDILPPELLGIPYPALVPATDADGNEVAGIRLPEIAVPTATYTGWGLRAYPAGANEGCDHNGQRIAFAATRADRLANGDPRLSLEERYASHAAYVAMVTAAATALMGDRFLLAEDVDRYVAGAELAPVGN